MDPIRQATLDLQIMLAQLSRRNPKLPRPAATGVFDETTLEAVMVFQRDRFPPVTGVVTEAVWNTITADFRQDQLRFGPPLDLRVLPDGDFSSPRGEFSYPMLIAETVFAALPAPILNFSRQPSGGINSGSNHENMKALQRLAGLPDRGTLDRTTWDFLARLYHALVVRGTPLNDG